MGESGEEGGEGRARGGEEGWGTRGRAMEGSSPQESLIIWRFIHNRVCVCL